MTPGISSSQAKPRVQPRRCRILIIEDHRDTLEMLRRLIVAKGHDVHVAASCAEAHAVVDGLIASGLKVDLVVGDIGLPDGDGISLMSRLKAKLDCTVVALTAYGMELDVRRCSEAGIDRHLLKPIGSVQLQAEIDRLCVQ